MGYPNICSKIIQRSKDFLALRFRINKNAFALGDYRGTEMALKDIGELTGECTDVYCIIIIITYTLSMLLFIYSIFNI